MTFLKKKSSGNIRQSIFDLRAFPGFFIYLFYLQKSYFHRALDGHTFLLVQLLSS